MYCFLSQLVISPQSGSSVNFFFTFANFFSNAKYFTNFFSNAKFFTNSKYFSKANSLQMPNTFSNAKSSTANFPRRGSVALLMSHHGSKLPVPLNRGRLLVVANFVRDHLEITGVTLSQPVSQVS